MPRFEITFEREVVAVDQFTRTIEAETEDAARAIAQEACGLYDHDCPDDAAPTGDGHDCQSWTVGGVERAEDDAEIDDLPSR